MFCSCCQEEYRQGVLLGCNHIMCDVCYTDTLSIQLLKCSQCGTSFDTKDISSLSDDNSISQQDERLLTDTMIKVVDLLTFFNDGKRHLQKLMDDISSINITYEKYYSAFQRVITSYLRDLLTEVDLIIYGLNSDKQLLEVAKLLPRETLDTIFVKFYTKASNIKQKWFIPFKTQWFDIIKYHQFSTLDPVMASICQVYFKPSSVIEMKNPTRYPCELALEMKIKLSLINYQGDDINMLAVKIDYQNLKYVQHQTPEICLEAVKQNVCALQFVQHQTPEICLEAVKQNGHALQFVQHQTPEICMEAVKRNGYALKYVNHQTPEICLEAVKQDGFALQFVQHQTPEMCMEAVKRNGHALQFVQHQTLEICMEAVKQNGYALKYVNHQTLEMCMEAVKQDGCALQHVKHQTPEICMEAVKQDACALQHVKHQTPEICLVAIKNNDFSSQYINLPPRV